MIGFLLDNMTYDFLELGEKYNHFLAPEVRVLVNGMDLLRMGMAFSSVSVTTSVEASDALTFSIDNAFDPETQSFRWIDQFFLLGSPVEVEMGYSGELTSVFFGLITSVDFDYPSGGTPLLTVRGMDMSYLMMNGSHSDTTSYVPLTLLVAEIAAKYLLIPNVTPSTTFLDKVTRFGKDDYQFLKELAAKYKYEFFVTGHSLYFRNPLLFSLPVTALEWGKSLFRLNPSLDIGSQVSEFVVRGLEHNANRSIEATSSTLSKVVANGAMIVNAMSLLGKKKRRYVYKSVESSSEAQVLADALMIRQVMQAVSGDGECVGLPEIRAGRYIKFKGVGPQFLLPVYLHTVTHTINSSGYVTSFSFGANRSLVDALTESEVEDGSERNGGGGGVSTAGGTRDGSMNGVMRAKVTNNLDPERLGRVKLTYKVMEEEQETDWVRVATMTASNGSGSLFIPNEGDEVLVAFHMGELREPYVIGALWDREKNRPPAGAEDLGKNIRKIRTPAGHELLFDDDKIKGSVALKTAKGHKIELHDMGNIKITDDKSQNTIEMNTKNGMITIKNQAGASLKLDAKGEVTLTGTTSLNLKATSIALEADGEMNLKAGAALNIKSDGVVSVKGAMVKLNT